MPLALLDVLSHCTDPILLANAARVYERKLLLVRPDQHVAWRSDIAPSTAEEAAYVLDVARGAIVKKRGPQIPVLGALYRLLVRGPLSYFASTWFGRFLSRKRFEMGLVGTLMYRLSILARVKLLWLWMTV